jgi:hypothetical protein
MSDSMPTPGVESFVRKDPSYLRGIGSSVSRDGDADSFRLPRFTATLQSMGESMDLGLRGGAASYSSTLDERIHGSALGGSTPKLIPHWTVPSAEEYPSPAGTPLRHASTDSAPGRSTLRGLPPLELWSVAWAAVLEDDATLLQAVLSVCPDLTRAWIDVTRVESGKSAASDVILSSGVAAGPSVSARGSSPPIKAKSAPLGRRQVQNCRCSMKLSALANDWLFRVMHRKAMGGARVGLLFAAAGSGSFACSRVLLMCGADPCGNQSGGQALPFPAALLAGGTLRMSSEGSAECRRCRLLRTLMCHHTTPLGACALGGEPKMVALFMGHDANPLVRPACTACTLELRSDSDGSSSSLVHQQPLRRSASAAAVHQRRNEHVESKEGAPAAVSGGGNARRVEGRTLNRSISVVLRQRRAAARLVTAPSPLLDPVVFGSLWPDSLIRHHPVAVCASPLKMSAVEAAVTSACSQSGPIISQLLSRVSFRVFTAAMAEGGRTVAVRAILQRTRVLETALRSLTPAGLDCSRSEDTTCVASGVGLRQPYCLTSVSRGEWREDGSLATSQPRESDEMDVLRCLLTEGAAPDPAASVAPLIACDWARGDALSLVLSHPFWFSKEHGGRAAGVPPLGLRLGALFGRACHASCARVAVRALGLGKHECTARVDAAAAVVLKVLVLEGGADPQHAVAPATVEALWPSLDSLGHAEDPMWLEHDHGELEPVVPMEGRGSCSAEESFEMLPMAPAAIAEAEGMPVLASVLSLLGATSPGSSKPGSEVAQCPAVGGGASGSATGPRVRRSIHAETEAKAEPLPSGIRWGALTAPSCAGWLLKRGQTNWLGMRRWQRRWFVLDGGILRYYRTPHDAETRRAYPLRSTFVVLAAHGVLAGEGEGSRRSLSIMLVPSSSACTRTWELAGESRHVVELWVNALLSHGAHLVEAAPPAADVGEQGAPASTSQ